MNDKHLKSSSKLMHFTATMVWPVLPEIFFWLHGCPSKALMAPNEDNSLDSLEN